MKTLLSLLLALLLALQGTGPIFVQAKETIEEMPRSVDFSRPEPLTETEAGIEESDAEEEPEEVQKPAQEESKTNPENAPPAEIAAEEAGNKEQNEASEQLAQEEAEQPDNAKVSGSEKTDTSQAEQPEAENVEVEVKQPEDYYPLPEEPEGELVDYDLESRTYKTGDKQYTTFSAVTWELNISFQTGRIEYRHRCFFRIDFLQNRLSQINEGIKKHLEIVNKFLLKAGDF